MYEDYYKHWASNRDKAKKAKKGKTWCLKCDNGRVGEGDKCPVCKTVHNKGKEKPIRFIRF